MMVSPARTQSRPRQAWEMVSDLLMAIALMWVVPVTLGLLNAVITFLIGRL